MENSVILVYEEVRGSSSHHFLTSTYISLKIRYVNTL